MNLHIFRFLLISELVVLCVSWFCRDARCNPTGGKQMCLGQLNEQFFSYMSISKETFRLERRFLCDVMCFRRRCSCYIYLPDTRCILVFEGSPPADACVLRSTGTNVARGKPATSSTSLSHRPPGEALDGSFNTLFFSDYSSNDALTWWQVDLLTPYIIRGIILVPNQTIAPYWINFKDIEIYFSNNDAATSGGNFGTLVHITPLGSPANLHLWNVHVPDTRDSYQYVILVRRSDILDFSEIEVMA